MPDFFLDEFLEIEQKNLGQYLILFSILRKADFIFWDFYTSPALFRLLIKPRNEFKELKRSLNYLPPVHILNYRFKSFITFNFESVIQDLNRRLVVRFPSSNSLYSVPGLKDKINHFHLLENVYFSWETDSQGSECF